MPPNKKGHVGRKFKACLNPVGRPPTQEADPAIQLLSPTEKTAAAMGSGEDAGWISAAKRMRPD